MSKTKSILAALALTTALTAPAAILPILTAPPALAGEATPRDLSDLAAKVTPAVVNIQVTIEADHGDTMQMSDGGSAQQQMQEFMQQFAERFGMGPMKSRPMPKEQALGTGFIIDPSGVIVTNYHVAGRADSITVTMTDGKKYPAKLLGADQKTDIAVLKIKADKPLPYVEFGDTDKVRVGEAVMAVGNPFGLGGTVTSGIVSARGRDIHSGPFDDYIQTDAAINRGNSGGPLFDMNGKVIGINTAIFSPSGGSVGLGFAIPASIAKPVVTQLREHGKVERGLLGVEIQPVTSEIAQSLSLGSTHGALVAQVEPKSAAIKAGIKSGDVIKSVDDKKIGDVRDLTRTIAAQQPGSTVKIGLVRDGKDMTVEAKLGDYSSQQQAKADEGDNHKGSKAEPLSFGFSLAPITPEARQELGLKDSVTGALIAGVQPGSPADDKGLKPGDIIQQVGQDSVDGPKAAASKLREAKESKKPALLKIYREGTTRYVAVSPRAS